MDEFKNNQDWQPLYILCGLDKCSINIILCWNKVGIWNLVASITTKAQASQEFLEPWW
jgi:hypothetical protein